MVSFGLADACTLIDEQQATKFTTPGSWFQLAIVDRATKTLVGDCGIHFLADNPAHCELGTTIHPCMHRSGFASEALTCVLEALFERFQIERVRAIVDARNEAAVRLFRRLHFRVSNVAHAVWFKGERVTEFTFVILPDEWQLQKQDSEKG
ncbi:MAG: GNAT family N-acetyltransferase [Planctomycetales bacterium]|nr:GNAT family N-acetyltransferase [Planctomycetales bacterium]